MSTESTRSRPRKRKGIATNLILAAVLFAVSGAAYWLEIQKKRNPSISDEKKPHLLTWPEGQELESISIVEKDKGIKVEMSCQAHCKIADPSGDWRLVSPVPFKADQANVGTFVSGLMAANVQESLPVEGDAETTFKKYGLEKERREDHKAVLKLKGNPEPYTVYIGDNAAVGENMYALVSGPGLKMDSVKIVPNYLRNNVQRSVSYWRAKKLFDFAASEVEGFKLKNPQGGVEAARDGASWILLPGKQLGDSEALDTYVTGLTFLSAQEYVSDDKVKDGPKLGILPSTGHFTLTLKVAKRPDVKMDIYDFVKDKEPHLYAVFSDRPYVVSIERLAAERFTKTPNAFRFRNLLTAAEKEQTGVIDVTLAGKDQFEFKRDDKGWTLASGKIEKFDPNAVDKALTKVGAARIADFVGKKPIPADTPELSAWVLLDKSGKRLREFKIYGSIARGDFYTKLPTSELGKFDRGSGAAIPSKVADFEVGAPEPAPPAQTGPQKRRPPVFPATLPPGMTSKK